ncbi:hypothetical protein KY290_020644 [Solanum tuberosum]|uniref:Uncharacterized protein n=1 Tax=Solanum tuberosum TaxID=4113 RepID=A0ABQ7UZ77_SOLTU|nr:hypothetical protein KY290_020644 [Solanum tuberosum]
MDVLCLSLGSTFRGFDSSVLQPLAKVDTNSVSPGGTFEANIVKTEVVRQNLHWKDFAGSGEFFFFFYTANAFGPSKKGCTFRLSVSGGEADIAANDALDQANADTAAKNANVDLKELNVSSDKGEASFSVSMNIEDHTVYKKTQNIHNLVASGEGSANDGEKIRISAGTEEECYASAYESDGYQAFAGHVDTESVGCVREDDIYDDGKIREPMMQSIAQDPMAEGMNSGKNNESSSKNVHSSLCFTNEEKSYSMPLHTESYDDFVKACDEKAEKLHQKDSNLRSPLLDKEETTGGDEQRPIGAIYNVTSSSHFSLPRASDVTFQFTMWKREVFLHGGGEILSTKE